MEKKDIYDRLKYALTKEVQKSSIKKENIMKLGVSSYSYSRLVKAGSMKLLDVIPKAKEMGFDCIEFTTILPEDGIDPRHRAEDIRREAERTQLPIVNYAVGADMLAGSEGNLEDEVKRVKEQIDIAEILGTHLVRHDAAYGKFPANWQGAQTFDLALPKIADGCREITEYAATKGIRTMVENHGRFVQESLRIEKLVTAVNHQNFGVLIDIGNFVGADDAPEVAVGRLAPLAFHCHAKDVQLKSGMETFPGQPWHATRGGTWQRSAIIGHGNVPVAQCLRTLVKAGYDGVVSIEFEGMEDVLTGIQCGYDNLKRFIELAQA